MNSRIATFVILLLVVTTATICAALIAPWLVLTLAGV